MSEPRPHLSIGEVLSLLQDEFPDVTISKIRFLESQGLLNPERTPSGYRKFYDHDVEQLRWVLRQQKENFLPLKVIKDRLAAGQLDGPASESGLLDLAPVGTIDDPASANGTGAPTVPAGVAATGATPTPPPAASTEGPVVSASRPAAGSAVTRHHPGDPAARPAASTGASDPPRRPADPRPADPRPADPRPALRPAGAGSTPVTSEAVRPAPALAPTSAPPSTPRPAAPGAAGSGPSAPRPAAMASSVSLTADELCATTGIAARLLADLERFGLVSGRQMGPDVLYDDDAVVICRLSSTLAEAGIDPRHLRMFKVSAEREAGLYEQLALPRLRQQRPEARQEAVAQVTDLSGTAAELHAALLRRALRETLGPF